jgi:hypothetical protein
MAHSSHDGGACCGWSGDGGVAQRAAEESGRDNG